MNNMSLFVESEKVGIFACKKIQKPEPIVQHGKGYGVLSEIQSASSLGRNHFQSATMNRLITRKNVLCIVFTLFQIFFNCNLK